MAVLELLHIELDAINWQSGRRDLIRHDPEEFVRRAATTVQCATWSGSAPPTSSGSIMNAR
ncbi:MAG: hypothetical protein WA709_20955 [Stellaceae bacterium]